MPDLAFIKAGTLKNTSWLNPTMECRCETAQPWIDIDGTRQHAERNRRWRLNSGDDALAKSSFTPPRGGTHAGQPHSWTTFTSIPRSWQGHRESPPARLAGRGARLCRRGAPGLGRPEAWREVYDRLRAVAGEEDALEAIGDLRELLELEDLSDPAGPAPGTTPPLAALERSGVPCGEGPCPRHSRRAVRMERLPRLQTKRALARPRRPPLHCRGQGDGRGTRENDASRRQPTPRPARSTTACSSNGAGSATSRRCWRISRRRWRAGCCRTKRSG